MSLAVRVTDLLRRIAGQANELSTGAGAMWRRSLQIRVVGSTVALSSTVVLVLGGIGYLTAIMYSVLKYGVSDIG